MLVKNELNSQICGLILNRKTPNSCINFSTIWFNPQATIIQDISILTKAGNTIFFNMTVLISVFIKKIAFWILWEFQYLKEQNSIGAYSNNLVS